MPVSDSRAGAGRAVPFDLMPTAAAVVDEQGAVVGWSDEAARLLGRTAGEVLGRPISALLAPGQDGLLPPRGGSERSAAGLSSGAVVRAVHRDGRVLTLGVQASALADVSGSRRWHLSAIDLGGAPWWRASHSVVERFLTRSPYGIAVLDTDLRYVWLNGTLERMAGVSLEERLGHRMREVLPKLSPYQVERQLQSVLDTGVPVLNFEYRGYVPIDPGREHAFSTSILRLDDDAGRVLGVCYISVDITDRWRTRERLTLLTESGTRIGTTLDLEATARELTEVAVPGLADLALVDLLDPVLQGDEPAPPGRHDPPPLRRMAHLSVRTGNPEVVVAIGGDPCYPASSPMIRCLAEEGPVLQPSLAGQPWTEQDAVRGESRATWDLHSLMAVPVRARGTVLGVAVFIRSGGSDPFESEDLALAEELVSRAAVCLDNARRYTREHRMALTLQRSLLPQFLPVLPAIDAAYRYLPAAADGSAGGDWFDVLPLSGARVALVVGDMVGHGINAAAAMGRLRTAVHTLADMDLPPDELLAHLDDLVLRLVDERSAQQGDAETATTAHGATCLYVVHDPATGHCTMARAGHPAPAIITPDGRVTFADLPPGPPLGVGTLPFESAEFDLPEGSVLALFTDGLLSGAGLAPEVAGERLRAALENVRPGLEHACDDILAAMLPDGPDDDAVLLLARTHGLAADRVVTWELPSDPAVVAEARSLAAGALTAWGLDDLVFTTELVVSELVTNAIRYGSAPVTLRLINQAVLICEVSDGTSTSPRLRHARTTDEGGRGLFLVAQLCRRWGTRYTGSGKIIWAEQNVP
ncbi:SpoIIE family protein phosphatase [Kitasatospora sp. NPDC057015]|uniref:SpoIIE family protein phosphatase n=1 Tax=Kitasatospora sp. NPDC057015 TaxID=3346001 RepID=UPI003645496E